MGFRIVRLTGLSGSESSIYTVMMEGETVSLFDKFVLENKDSYGGEIQNIINRLHVIGNSLGARAYFFKLNEGKPGDGVCALYDEPEKHLRLYCIRYGNVSVILGGGGVKNEEVQAWQDDPNLSKEANLMIKISLIITDALKDKYSKIKFSPDGKELLGDLNFPDDER